jgi:hypothetical protein
MSEGLKDYLKTVAMLFVMTNVFGIAILLIGRAG